VSRACDPVNATRPDRFPPFSTVFTVYFQIPNRRGRKGLMQRDFFARPHAPETAGNGRKTTENGDRTAERTGIRVLFATVARIITTSAAPTLIWAMAGNSSR